MGVFSRRNLYRMLVENSRFVRQRPLSEHIKRLNGSDAVQRVTTEWEAVALNGLSKLGRVDHEPRLPGTSKPDAMFTHALGTALIDITSVSDRGLDSQNPIAELSERLVELVNKRRLSIQHFRLEAKGNWRELRIGGPRPRLSIPRMKDFDNAIFNEAFHRFLDDVQKARGRSQDFSVARDDVQVTITYDPSQSYFSINHLSYTVPFSVTQNTIYAALEDKAKQLKLSQFTGLKGVLLCDGGCDTLNRHGQRGLNLDASDIIFRFLADYRLVDFVMTMLVESDRSGRLGSEHLRLMAKAYVLQPDSPAAPLVAHLSERLPLEIPHPENTPNNAYDLDNKGKSFDGGGSMGSQSIKMSSRSVMGLLSGETRQEDFLLRNPHVKERFAIALREGRMLKEASIQSGQQRDDDWIEFSFSEPDPAISPFPKLRGQ